MNIDSYGYVWVTWQSWQGSLVSATCNGLFCDSMDLIKCVVWLTGANLKLENGSEVKSEGNALVSSENKMPESSNANSSSNSSGVPASTKPVAVGSTQQTDMKLPTEVGKEENPAPTPE